MVRVLIADDNAMMRGALRWIVSSEPDFDVVAEAADGNAAMALALELQPDIVLADFSMPGPSGIDIAAALRVRLPHTRVLVVSLYEDAALVREALAAGAAAYLSKITLDTRLIPAIRKASRELSARTT